MSLVNDNKRHDVTNKWQHFFSRIAMVSAIGLVLYLLLGIYNVSANGYNVQLWANNVTGTMVKNPVLSFDDLSATKIISMNGYVSSYSANPYLVTYSFYSPFDTLKTTSTKTYSTQQNCVDYGSINVDSLENKGITTGTATSLNTSVKSTIGITTSQNTLTFDIDSLSDLDSLGNLENYYFANDGLAQATSPQMWTTVQSRMNQFTYSFSCNANITNQFYPNDLEQYVGYTLNPCGGSARGAIVNHRFFVFNSSNAGQIEYKFNLTANGWVSSGGNPAGAGSATYNYSIGYYEMIYPTSWNHLSSTSLTSGNLTLLPNTIYVFQISEMISYGGQPSCTISPQYSFNESKHDDWIKIDVRVPVWSCGEWTNCTAGIQTRLCADTTGSFVDKVDSQICYSGIAKSINIGFEDSKNVNVFYIQPDFLCYPSLKYKTVQYPDDWNLDNATNPMVHENTSFPITITGYPYDTLMITSEESHSGINSLKVWTIPPEQVTGLYGTFSMIPSCPYPFGSYADYCGENQTGEISLWGNYSTALYPELKKDVNETYMVSKDMTFDFPNVTLSFYAKKCNKPVQEWSGNSSLFGVCGEGYYSSDKSPNHEIKDTNIFFYLYDYNLSENIVSLRTIINSENWQKQEIRLFGLLTNHLYQLKLGVYTNVGDILLSSDNFCAYLDDVEINGYLGAVNCNSYCNLSTGTYYQVDASSMRGCSFTEFPVSEHCKQAHATDIRECNSFCECNIKKTDYLTLYIANNETKTCKWIITGNATYCADFCKISLKDSQGILSIGQEFLNDANLGWASNFLTPFFILMAIFIGISALLAYKMEAWQVFPIGIVVFIMTASFLWIEFAPFGIIITVVVLFLLIKMWNVGNTSNK